MQPFSHLTVLECRYKYAGWKIETAKDRSKILSSVTEFSERRAAEDYRLCGVYHKAGVPFIVRDLDYGAYLPAPPHIGIPRAFSDASFEAVKRGDGLLVADGYCVYAPAVLGGIQRAVGTDKRLGLVWLDAHADNKIAETTKLPEITMVGVPLSSSLGQTLDSWRVEACGLQKSLCGKDVLLSDYRVQNDEGVAALREAEVRVLSHEELQSPAVWQAAVGELASRVDALYLSVDMDILDTPFVPAYFREVPGGSTVWTIMDRVRTVMETGKVLAYSVFCADFDKYAQGGDITYLNAMRLIGAGLENWKSRPFF